MITPIALLTLLLPRAADAFGGTYVGADGAPVNRAARLVLVRQGNETTLTMEPDYEGDIAEFGLLVPIPHLLQEDDVAVVDPRTLDALDRYSAPRLVSYTCEELEAEAEKEAKSSGGCFGPEPRRRTYDTAATPDLDLSQVEDVVVVDTFVVGEYEVSILATRDADPLLEWLDAGGFSVPAESEALLDEYIAEGSYFLAAKVHAEAAAESQRLTPLQVRYGSSQLSLPIRLGTLNSPGVQDLIVLAINDAYDGEMRIANYPELSVESECMVDPNDSFSGFYEEWFADATDLGRDGVVLEPFDLPPAGPVARWAVEFSWDRGRCEPCAAGQPLGDDVVQDLGYDGRADQAHVTRLHMRYQAGAITEDLRLSSSGSASNTQLRYVAYEPYLEDTFPICGAGFLDDPGTCDERAEREGEDDDALCSGIWLGFSAFGLAGLIRRRRRG